MATPSSFFSNLAFFVLRVAHFTQRAHFFLRAPARRKGHASWPTHFYCHDAKQTTSRTPRSLTLSRLSVHLRLSTTYAIAHYDCHSPAFTAGKPNRHLGKWNECLGNQAAVPWVTEMQVPGERIQNFYWSRAETEQWGTSLIPETNAKLQSGKNSVSSFFQGCVTL